MAGGINFSALNISASGLSAERMRMEVVASNIANAQATRAHGDQPYRRKQVVFATALEHALGGNSRSGGGPRIGGVNVVGIQEDNSDFPKVYIPGHPHADENGMVAMPNVKLPNEMVDLVTASRSYEANLRAIRSFREMAEQTLALLRAG